MLYKRILVYLRTLLDLHEDKESEQTTIESITRNISFHGTKLWVLAFAIFIASIGLNVNSTAVIIGAMLISPLMGPIVGAGLALGINDFVLLKRSLLNLLIATVISFLVSSFYFWISPLREAQSELLARTHPNIYDVMIAFFGGLAGIVGSSRKEKGIIIPGVAIATALMPPLCTAGYGFATLQFKYFFGAFYLYLINCTFISLATFIMVKYLKYTTVRILDKTKARHMKWLIAVIIASMLVPSAYFAYDTIKTNKYYDNAEKFLSETFLKKGFTIIYKNITYPKEPALMEIAFLTKRFDQNEIDSLQQLIPKYGLGNTRLLVKQRMDEFTKDEWEKVLDNIENKDEKIKAMEEKLNAPNVLTEVNPRQLISEVKAINQNVERIDFGTLFRQEEDNRYDTSVIIIVYKNPTSRKFTNDEAGMLRNWFKARLNKGTVVTIFQSIEPEDL